MALNCGCCHAAGTGYSVSRCRSSAPRARESPGVNAGASDQSPRTNHPLSHLHDLHEVLHVIDGALEHLALLIIELDLEDLLHAVRAEQARHADEVPADAVFLIAVSG